MRSMDHVKIIPPLIYMYKSLIQVSPQFIYRGNRLYRLQNPILRGLVGLKLMSLIGDWLNVRVCSRIDRGSEIGNFFLHNCNVLG